MKCKVNSIFTFEIVIYFNQCAEIFDSEETDKRNSEFYIKLLFRGVSKEGPQKVFVFDQSSEWGFQNLIESNGELTANHKVNLSTMKESTRI